MARYHPLNPEDKPRVDSDFDKGVVRMDLPSIGGEVDQYELMIEEARRLGQRLLDSAEALRIMRTTMPRRRPAT